MDLQRSAEPDGGEPATEADLETMSFLEAMDAEPRAPEWALWTAVALGPLCAWMTLAWFYESWGPVACGVTLLPVAFGWIVTVGILLRRRSRRTAR